MVEGRTGLERTPLHRRMNPRERFLRACRRQSVDRVPKHAFWTPEVVQKVKAHTGFDDPDECFGIEVKNVVNSCFDFNPDFDVHFRDLESQGRTKKKNWDDWNEGVHGPRTVDEWGVYRDFGGFYHFNRMTHTMADLESAGDLKKWPWPVLCDEVFFTDVKNKTEMWKKREIATVGYYNCIFEQAWYLRGMDRLFLDFYYDRSFAGYLLDRITEINRKAAARLVDVGVDIFFTGDDVATQLDMMMSVDMWRKWIKPRTKSIIDTIKCLNPRALIWYHSDGNNYKILPDLVEIGCDVLHPIQPECMDPVKVHRELGGQAAFWGTIGTQSLMPFGTPGQIKDEVRRIISEFDAFGGGLIIAPTHYLEPDVPWENITAFFEAVDEAAAG
jgi:uroporphyrinogen decarboxylase